MATETLRPNAAGDETAIANQSPESDYHWDKVDEITQDGNTTAVRDGTGAPKRDLYNIPNHTTGSGTINFITIYICCKALDADYAGQVKPSLKSNSTVTDGDGITPTASYVTYSQQWNTNPADSAAWEWADIDALQIGVLLYSHVSGIDYCTQVYVVVNYTVTTEQAVGGGAVAIAGSLGRNIFVTRGEGSVGIAGSLGRNIFVSVGAGAVGMAGSLSAVKRFIKAVGAGSVGIAGTLERLIKVSVGAGSVAIAGTLNRLIKVAVGSGSIAIAGTLALKFFVDVGAGALAIAGALARLIKIAVGGGAVTPVGALELEYSLGIQVNETAVDILKGSLVVEQRIEERSIAEFTIVDLPGTASYLQGHKVMVYDPDNTLIFGGIIDNPETIRAAPSGELLHPIRCKDWHYLADKRLVAESYLNKTCGFIVDDIFDKYLADEGVTIGNIELGATLVEAVFNYVRASDAYDALAEKAGKIWYIDENKALYFQARDAVAAPWTLTGDDIIKRSARLSGGNPLYRNRQYIRGGRGTTALQTEKFVADGEQNAFTLSFPLMKVPTFVEVNTVDKTPLGIKGLDAPGDFASYWNKGDPTVYLTDVPDAGWVVEIRYYGQFPILTLVEDTDEIAAQLAIEGAGTGYVDDIADEPTLNDKDASFDSGLAKLARFGVAGKRFPFSTTRSGLKPGQLLQVNYPALSLDTQMLIESVRIRSIREHLTYDVTAIHGPELGSWSNLFKALAAMKGEVIERLNVGAEQILIILVSEKEVWGWNEDTPDPTVFTCDVIGTGRVGTAIVC